MEQLSVWGLYAEQVKVCDRLLELLDKADSYYLVLLGQAYYTLGRYNLAQLAYQQCLELSKLEGNRPRQMMALSGLAHLQRIQGHCDQALGLYRDKLSLAHELADQKAVGAAWGDIGTVYQSSGDYCSGD